MELGPRAAHHLRRDAPGLLLEWSLGEAAHHLLRDASGLLISAPSLGTLLKRAHEPDSSTCPDCGGVLRVLDVALRFDVTDRILGHLDQPTTRWDSHTNNLSIRTI